ncbi:MAG: hypothetical protein WCA39_15550 [Nitrososphaeraceae archaeon]
MLKLTDFIPEYCRSLNQSYGHNLCPDSKLYQQAYYYLLSLDCEDMEGDTVLNILQPYFSFFATLISNLALSSTSEEERLKLKTRIPDQIAL